MINPIMLVLRSVSTEPEMIRAVFFRYAVIVILFSIIGLSVYVLLKAAILRIVKKKSFAEQRWILAAASVVVIVSISAAIYALYIEPDWVKINCHSVTTSKWKSGRSLKIAHLSDLHAEKGSELRFSRALEAVKKEKPDLLVLTGDYDNESTPYSEQILGRFASALVKISPVFAVEGNWDTMKTLQLLEKSGARVLRNEAQHLVIRDNSLVLVGSDSFRYDLLRRILRPDPSAFLIVVSHTPLLFEESASLGADLFLCGHTHGGQIQMPLIGTICPYYDIIGKYQLGDYRYESTTMIINGGLGMEGGSCVVRIRFGVRPDVGIVEIRGK